MHFISLISLMLVIIQQIKQNLAIIRNMSPRVHTLLANIIFIPFTPPTILS
jgi:hypothetical protein